MWEWVSIALTLAGLILTAVGAYVTAKAVIITDEQATRLAGTYWNLHVELAQSLKAQSRSAKTGLGMVVGGTLLQIVEVGVRAALKAAGLN